jgi:hypothetical protein
MARNYFTDVIGATEQAFERGRSSMEQSRQRMGQSRAAKSLARGDVEGAKRAFGEAGMVEQVDTLAQRQRQQREAEAAMASEAEQTAYERQQDLLKQQSEQEQLTYERGQQDRKDKLEFFTNGVTMLSSIPQQNRMQAFETLVPTLQAMGMDEGTIQQLRTAPMDDASLNAMKLALGQDAQKLQASVSTGAVTVYDPATGQVRYIRAPGAPETATGGMTPYQAAQLTFRQEEAEARREEKAAAAETKREEKRQIARKSIGQLSEGVGLIDRLTSSSGFEKMYGKSGAFWYSADPTDWRTLATTPNDVLDSIILLEQVTGQAFLGGVQQLKGLGPLSDREGRAVQAAMTRLGNRLLSTEEARVAAQEFKTSLQRLINAAAEEGQLSREELQNLLGISPTGGQRENFVTRPGASGAPPAFSGVTRQGAPGATRRPPRVVSVEEE